MMLSFNFIYQMKGEKEMNELERKTIAFLLDVIYELSVGHDIDENKVQQIVNLMDEFDTCDLDEREFRY